MKIKTEKEIETDGLNIVQLKDRIKAIIAELEAEGFDPKESVTYFHEWKDTLEVACCRDETPEETARRVAQEEAERVTREARIAERAEQKRLRDLREKTLRLEQAERAARHHEMSRILAGKTLAELRRMRPL